MWSEYSQRNVREQDNCSPTDTLRQNVYPKRLSEYRFKMMHTTMAIRKTGKQRQQRRECGRYQARGCS
ncbi:hypothetical protein DPMN_008915 [Dreissena polymorpha]|uniref:Uncharacterized protein n=1 Tax=Dreissena polymorpha TaxID=45954 RepID=A0A9D4N095_DREPO|nr:hypothetical protein DPMN_008915 [Dreissena polymorpha]